MSYRTLLALLTLAALPTPVPAAPPDEAVPADRRWSADGEGGEPGFLRHVEPLLARAGCSNRNCHGSFQGKGGFRLSLFGSDPKFDRDQLLDGRVDAKNPADSLALLKPTTTEPHKGGKRFPKDGWEYRLLRDWIAAGAPFKPGGADAVTRIEVVPPRLVLGKAGEEVALRVVARFADGTTEDVTPLSQFSSNDDAVAAVTVRGRVKAGRPGGTAVVVTYGGEVRAVPVLVPRAVVGPPAPFPANNRIDELTAANWADLGVRPSDVCDDATFLRRVSLDIVGTLPTPAEVRAFLADTQKDKRDRKIDELLGRPEYTVWWTTRLCDLTGLNAPLFLGNTNFGPHVGDMWHKWMGERVRENAGYDKIAAGLLLGTSRRTGEGYGEYATRMSSYVKTTKPADIGAEPTMPHFWFRQNLKDPEERALGVAYSFLGVRLECAQCHKHPFDRWTQDDFRKFAAVFSRVRTGVAPDAKPAHDAMLSVYGAEVLRTAATKRQAFWADARAGKPAPWPEVYVAPPDRAKKQGAGAAAKLLGGPAVDLDAAADPRAALVEWLRSPANPYFAPAFVNRVWAHYFGRGLVHPVDDFSLANPATHPEVLDHLSRGFVASGFDMKWLHREITRSRTYQLSWKPNDTNRDDEKSFSRAVPRRLAAEVAIDAVDRATAGTKRRADNLAGRRIGVQPTADLRRTEYGLAVFGKPLRKVNCDCEREEDPSLLQSIYLRNDPDVAKMLDRADGWLKEVKATDDPAALVTEAYLRALSRPPDAAELKRCRDYLAESPSVADGLRDVLWALINSQEFITNH